MIVKSERVLPHFQNKFYWLFNTAVTKIKIKEYTLTFSN